MSLSLIIARDQCVSGHVVRESLLAVALTEKAWEDAVQGLGKRFSRHSSRKFETSTKVFQQSTLGAVYMEGGRS